MLNCKHPNTGNHWWIGGAAARRAGHDAAIGRACANCIRAAGRTEEAARTKSNGQDGIVTEWLTDQPTTAPQTAGSKATESPRHAAAEPRSETKERSAR